MNRSDSQPAAARGILTVTFWTSSALGSLGLAFAVLLAQTKGGRSFPMLVFSLVATLLLASLLLGNRARAHRFVKVFLIFELLFCLYGLWSVST